MRTTHSDTRPQAPPNSRRARLAVVTAVACALAVGACGGKTTATGHRPSNAPSGSQQGAGPPNADPTAAPGATTSAAPTSAPVALDKTVWWSPDRDQHGLVKIHFTEAQLDAAASIPTITLTFTAENQQAASRHFSFGTESVLTVDGKAASQPQPNDLELASSGTGTGTVVFQVDASAKISDAVLTLGDPSSNQSIVPLNPSAAVTTTQPTTGFATGTLHGPDHDVAITASTLYADTTLGQKGKSVLALTVTATYTGTEGGLIGTSNFSLKTPDGTDTPGVQIVGEPLEPLNGALNPGQSTPAQLLGFEVDQPTAGAYTLTYTSSQGPDEGQTADIAFTVS